MDSGSIREALALLDVAGGRALRVLGARDAGVGLARRTQAWCRCRPAARPPCTGRTRPSLLVARGRVLVDVGAGLVGRERGAPAALIVGDAVLLPHAMSFRLVGSHSTIIVSRAPRSCWCPSWCRSARWSDRRWWSSWSRSSSSSIGIGRQRDVGPTVGSVPCVGVSVVVPAVVAALHRSRPPRALGTQPLLSAAHTLQTKPAGQGLLDPFSMEAAMRRVGDEAAAAEPISAPAPSTTESVRTPRPRTPSCDISIPRASTRQGIRSGRTTAARACRRRSWARARSAGRGTCDGRR